MCEKVKISEGYQYCESCELITPHSSYRLPYREPICDVCGHYEIEYCKCPNCGWNHDPDRDLYPEKIKVKVHKEDCEYFDIKTNCDDDDIKPYFNIDGSHINLEPMNCDCPEVDCYPASMIINYRESYVFSMDCSNAREWSYDVICPICREVFEVYDGNC